MKILVQKRKAKGFVRSIEPEDPIDSNIWWLGILLVVYFVTVVKIQYLKKLNIGTSISMG